MIRLHKYVEDFLRAGVKAIKPYPGETNLERFRFAKLMYIWSLSEGSKGIAPFRDAMWRVAKGDLERYSDAMFVVNKLFYEYDNDRKRKEKLASDKKANK